MKRKFYSIISGVLILTVYFGHEQYDPDVEEQTKDNMNSGGVHLKDTIFPYHQIKKRREANRLRQKRFNTVKEKFSKYNKNISDSTVETFLNVCNAYDLIKNKGDLNVYASQICVESGAKHLDSNGHVIKSSGNAIGIAQIVPTTAFFYLKYYMGTEDKELFAEHGIDTSFVEKYEAKTVFINKDSSITYISGEGRRKTIEWLSDQKNNIYLWGCIMARNLKRFNMHETLVAYNQGPNFLKKVTDPSEHIYVKKVRRLAGRS